MLENSSTGRVILHDKMQDGSSIEDTTLLSCSLHEYEGSRGRTTKSLLGAEEERGHAEQRVRQETLEKLTPAQSCPDRDSER